MDLNIIPAKEWIRMQSARARERNAVTNLGTPTTEKPGKTSNFDISFILKRLVKIGAPIVCLQLVPLGYHSGPGLLRAATRDLASSRYRSLAALEHDSSYDVLICSCVNLARACKQKTVAFGAMTPQVLAIGANIHLLDPTMNVGALEFYAGQHEVSKAQWRNGVAAYPMDIRFDGDTMDILSARGSAEPISLDCRNDASCFIVKSLHFIQRVFCWFL